MIQLYDYYNDKSKDLHYSLQQSGFEGPVVVFNDDGFLPKGISSPYTYFCHMQESIGKPLYFNQVPIPRFWEITGNNGSAEVWSYDDRKANIYYAEPKHLRLVKAVDWLDKQGRVRMTDHYNQFGWLFARSFYGEAQQMTIKTYFNQEGQEIIVENMLTGDIILNWQGKVQFFQDRLQFFRHYITLMGWDQSRIWYNSLSTPFFYSFYHQEPGQDILFWQEGIGEEIPGNMKVLLNQSNARTQAILVQQKAVFDKLITLLDDQDKAKCHYLGHIYPSKRANLNRKRIFIFTNSDQIEHLSYLVSELSDYDFHIAALTEMSHRLSVFDHHKNVQLYPNISPNSVDSILNACDIYFDINRSDEVMGVVRQAFEHNMLIFGFDQTLHQPQLILEEHIVSLDHPERLVSLLKSYEGRLSQMADKQRQSIDEKRERYQSYLD